MSFSTNKIVVCSVMVAPIRLLTFYKLRTWLDQVVRIVVHTFAVEAAKVPLNPANLDGYWYCAGDFLDIDEAGVYQHIGSANIDLAKCLVAQNIKDNDPLRKKLVISGEYGVNYVCHNITNRILYATDAKSTLIDLDIKTTGYEIVVKSSLGIYGQNKFEWDLRKRRCAPNTESCDIISKDAVKSDERTREEEIHRIHLRASGYNREKAESITRALTDVDNTFYCETENIISQYNERRLDRHVFDQLMIKSCSKLFRETIRIVGIDIAGKIFLDCDISSNHVVTITKEEVCTF